MKVKGNSKGLYAGLVLAVSMQFGFVGTSGAAACLVTDVTIGGSNATSCGWGTTNIDQTPTDSTWQVNLDNAGTVNTWSAYEREEGAVDEFGAPLANVHDGNTSIINLTADMIGDSSTSGSFTLNVFDPTLITLKGPSPEEYHWYYFEGITGTALIGSWDSTTAFGTAGLSGIGAYVVPVPAAVWLFATGLLGLIGVARKRA